MIFAMLITLPLEGIAVGLNREPTLFVSELTKGETSGCLSLVREGVFNAGPVFYLSHLGFDLFAICLSVYHLYKHTEKSAMPMQIIRHGVALMLLDAFVNTLTFLASLGVPGIKEVGSLPSIAITVIGEHLPHDKSIDNSPATGNEFKHEVIALPHTMGTKVYKGSDAHFESNGSLPQFANSRNLTPLSHNRPGYGKRSSIAAASDRGLIGVNGAGAAGAHRSTPSIDGSTSVFHSCVGREALKFRVDGDINMFHSKTSLCAPTTPTDDLSKGPIPLDIKRLSQQREAAAKRLSVRSIGRPETATSGDQSSTG
ncbi:hypothetical protein CPB86DRAFT_766464 [Serendipita vermifera]|nr:hypothetical protein CPB86DRAFT_766464 [Serendipita vermifera]